MIDNQATETQRPLRRYEASKYLFEKHGINRTVGTLAKLATVGNGPAFHKCNKVVLYSRHDLDSWAQAIRSATVTSTSQLRQ